MANTFYHTNDRRLFQYRKRYGLHAIFRPDSYTYTYEMFQYRKRYGLHAINRGTSHRGRSKSFQYRKRYGLHAIEVVKRIEEQENMFQYRKRYGLHAIADPEFFKAVIESFNTASGMDCMQFHSGDLQRQGMIVSIPQAVWIACNGKRNLKFPLLRICFNTASGMDCMQSVHRSL